MKPYESYMDTPESHWYSKLPISWKSQRLKTLFGERRTIVSDKDYPALSVGSAGIVPQLKTAVKTNNGDHRKLICAGDFAINSRSDRKGACGISEYTGSCSLIITVLRPHSELNNHFFHYLLRSHFFSEEFYRNGFGIVSDLWTTRWKDMRNIPVPVPPREEQEQIVRFLDWKVSAIDKLIATKKHQLCSLTALNSTMEKNLVLLGFDAAYPKNPPSVDWKENIPAHWKIRPLKRIFKILSGATPKSEIPEYWDGNIAWITPADYKTQDKYISHGSRNITEAGYTSCSTNMIPRGSIIFSKRAPIGTVAINDIELCTNQGCLSCIPIKDASATYYYYLMSCFTDVFEMNASGTTFKEISATTFGNMKVPFPPINEQKEIAAYLDARHTKYARFAETTQKEIIVLNELKTRLISDAVTGKIDVRSIKLPNFAKEE